MPNTPALVGAGMTAICNNFASDEDLKVALKVFSAVGETIIIDEKYIDAVVGVSGSGPAYIFTLIEAMADGAVSCGLPRKKALEYAAAALEGAAAMVLETGCHPGELKDAVCSPGGSTIAGVRTLENGAFRSAVMDAVIASYARGQELGK